MVEVIFGGGNKVEDMQDKDTYRGQISHIFFKPRESAAVEQAKTEGRSQ